MTGDLIVYTPMYVTFFWSVVLLLSKQEKNRARFLLGIFMFMAFLVYLSHAIFFQKTVDVYQVFDPIYIFSSLSVYPLYYWYIKLLTVETRLHWTNLRMLLPGALFGLIAFGLYLQMPEGEKYRYIEKFLLSSPLISDDSILISLQKWNYILSRVVFSIQVIFFLVKGRKLVLKYNRQVANFYSNLESRTLAWVKYLLYSFVATSIASVIFNTIGRDYFLDSIFLLLIPSSVFSVLLFFIGLLGYKQNHTVVDLRRDEKNDSVVLEEKPKEKLREQLVDLFDQKNIYRKPDLKITEVASLIGTNRSYVSSLINNSFSCSFNEYVNEYRVIEAKKLLTDESKQHYSLNYIAEAAGFGSVGTFIRVFRTFEDMTPGKYREKAGIENKRA